MTSEAKQIFDEALALSDSERLELAEALFDSLSTADQARIDEAWRAEIVRRMEQVRNGEVQLESWDEVRRAGRDALSTR